MHIHRLVLAFVLVATLWLSPAAAEEPTEVTVYKSPTCGCCGKWVSHLEEHGFRVTTHEMPDVTPVKVQAGLPSQLASCHTAFVEGYLIEGHVPASDVKRLLVRRLGPQAAVLRARISDWKVLERLRDVGVYFR